MIENNSSVPFPANIINDFHGSLPQWWHNSIQLTGKNGSIVYDAFISASNISGWPYSVMSSINSSVGDEIADSQFMRSTKINKAPLDYMDQLKHAIRLRGARIQLRSAIPD